jgi:L-malate glycosyltransferase
MAKALQAELRQLGTSEIFAHFIAEEMTGDVRPLRDLPRATSRDVLIYHASYGEPEVTRFLLARPEKIVLVYHNITPSSLYLAYEPQFAAGLHWGRHELTLLRDRVVLAVADSKFNADDLVGEGFTDTKVVPAGLKPSRLLLTPPNVGLAKDLSAQFPHGFVLAVSQVLPHKRFEDIVGALHLAQWGHQSQLGLVVVGRARMPSYFGALQRYAKALCVRHVQFVGAVDNRDLATYLRCACVFVSASAHEGLAIPPLEAMAFGVPVIARAAGAIEETLGKAALILPRNSGPSLMAEAMVEVTRNESLRQHLIFEGYKRVRAIESDEPGKRFVNMLQQAGV